MAAQDTDKAQKACPRCYAQVPADVDICPECGASIGDGISLEGADAAVYPELAKSNLLRMRGEYRQAEEQCLSILKRYPNNASANILLGDICADRGDWDQAEQWYELALDLDPDSEATREKLETVRKRLKRLEVSETIGQLGLPDRPGRTGLYAAAALAGIVVIGFVIYAAATGPARPTQTEPIQIAPDSSNAAPTNAPPSSPPTAPTNASPAAPDPTQGSEVSAFQVLAASNPDAGKILNVFQDPRSMHVTVIFRLDQGEDPRMIAARLGRAAIERFERSPAATLRGMRQNEAVYVADVPRARVLEVSSPAWQGQNGTAPEAWGPYILTNEWFAPANAPPDSAATDGAPAAPPPSPATNAPPPTGTTG